MYFSGWAHHKFKSGQPSFFQNTLANSPSNFANCRIRLSNFFGGAFFTRTIPGHTLWIIWFIIIFPLKKPSCGAHSNYHLAGRSPIFRANPFFILRPVQSIDAFPEWWVCNKARESRSVDDRGMGWLVDWCFTCHSNWRIPGHCWNIMDGCFWFDHRCPDVCDVRLLHRHGKQSDSGAAEAQRSVEGFCCECRLWRREVWGVLFLIRPKGGDEDARNLRCQKMEIKPTPKLGFIEGMWFYKHCTCPLMRPFPRSWGDSIPSACGGYWAVPLPFAHPASSMNLMFAIRLVWKFTEKTSLLAIYRGQLAMFYDFRRNALCRLEVKQLIMENHLFW